MMTYPIKQKLRFERNKRRLTLQQVSERVGLSVSYLSDMERGRTNPSLKSLQKLANAYNMSISALLIGVEIDVEVNQ